MSSTTGLGEQGENLSILIPTYNCAELLRETLQSLKDQGDRIALAQIRVIDDVSTKDDPEKIVEEVWPGRVSFYRHPKNVGPCANFNACIDQAERRWIHIVHGDDSLLPWAYEEHSRIIDAHPDILASFSRVVFMDATGRWNGVSNIWTNRGDEGKYVYDPTEWCGCPLQFAGVMFTRDMIDMVGGFDCAFSHAQDWNLWWRMAATGRAGYTLRPTAAYRIFEGNHSSKLLREGRNIAEYLEQLNRLKADCQQRGTPLSDRTIYGNTTLGIVLQARRFRKDREAFRNNMRYLRQVPTSTWPKLALIRTILGI